MSLKNLFSTLLLALFFTTAKSQDHINSVFDISWENYVGLTSYRTGMQFQNGKLYIPSHGEERHLPGDDLDGIHVLDALTGKEKLLVQPESDGDQDCNGVVLHGDFLFFGNDDGAFYCYDVGGKLIWKSEFDNWFKGETGPENDVEGVPVLCDLNGDGFPDIAFNVESNGLVALDGKTGKAIWSFKYISKAGTYMNSPAVFDLNNDGTKDLIIGGKRDKDEGRAWDYRYGVHAINGKTGSPLWTYSTNSNVHASPIVIHSGNQARVVIAESYSDVTFLRPDGKFDKFVNLNLISTQFKGGISGLFSSPIMTDQNQLIIGTSWWGEDDGVWQCDLDSDNFKMASDQLLELKNEAKNYHVAGPVSSSALVADVLKGSKGMESIICTEKGEMLIFSRKGSLLKRLKLPAGVEATPLIADIDNDKKSELILACLDGKIYCYKTGVKSKKRIHVGQFRINANNDGVIKLKSL
jgi:outer membrane protein assembly factor BamB